MEGRQRDTDSERDRQRDGGWRGDRETQTVSETERWGVEGRQRDTDSERDRQRDGGWRGDRETQTVSETDREMGGGGETERHRQ